MKPKRPQASDLGYGYCNNGITVYDKSRDLDNDYLPVALIDRQRKVTLFNVKLSEQQIDAINTYAATADPTVSVTQQKVFETRPTKAKTALA